jgi:hypothetical protein
MATFKNNPIRNIIAITGFVEVITAKADIIDKIVIISIIKFVIAKLVIVKKKNPNKMHIKDLINIDSIAF